MDRTFFFSSLQPPVPLDISKAPLMLETSTALALYGIDMQ